MAWPKSVLVDGSSGMREFLATKMGWRCGYVIHYDAQKGFAV